MDVAFIGGQEMLGAGSETNPFQIKTAAQLAALATAVNGGANQSGVYYIQTAHLDLSGYASGAGWVSIGSTYELRFMGSYDGNGLTISNLTMATASGGTGLFGVVDGTIKNIIIYSGSLSGMGAIGAVAATISGGIISGCTNYATITGSGIAGSYSSTGGIVGLGRYNTTYTVTNCSNFGTITENAPATSAVYIAGGIIGFSNSSSATLSYNLNAGQVVSTNGAEYTIDGGGQTVTNCYHNSTVCTATANTGSTARATAYCQGTDALSNVDKLSGLGTTYWKPLTGYPVPIKARV